MFNALYSDRKGHSSSVIALDCFSNCCDFFKGGESGFTETGQTV